MGKKKAKKAKDKKEKKKKAPRKLYKYYTVKGDNSPLKDPFKVRFDDVVGVVVYNVE